MANTSESSDDYKRWTVGRIVSLLLLVLILGFWIWALSPLAPSGHPDKLDDPTFALEAGPLCTGAVSELAILPLALSSKSPEERAQLIDSGTVIYRNLLKSLAVLAPDEATSDGEIIRLWIDDYEVYLQDRDAYAQNFRNGIDEAFTVSKKGRRWVTEPIDEFAKANDIKECMTPLDV
jgi:hypothetical protein